MRSRTGASARATRARSPGLDDHAAQDLALGLVEERALSVRQTEQLVREVAAGSMLQTAARHAVGRPRHRTAGGGPSRRPGHQGLAHRRPPGRPDHDHLVRRGRPGSSRRPAHGRTAMNRSATQPEADDGTTTRRARTAKPPAPTAPTRSRCSKGSRRSGDGRACTSAPPMAAACTTWCGRSSTTASTRRWPATRRTSRSPSVPMARPQRGQRPRRARRQAEADRQGRPRGRAHRAARRRQVRRRRLQGLRWPPRRRRERGQRAVRVAARRIGPRRPDLGPGVRPRQAHRARSG